MIQHYPNALSHEQCQIIIQSFERSPHKIRGKTGHGGVRKDIKSSTDIHVKGTQDDLLLNNLEPYYWKYCKQYSFLNRISNMISIDAGYNIQRYLDDEGYFAEHCEHSPNNPKRVLAWMYYLNDAVCGTTWIHQDYTSTVSEGSLYIWPSFWTHAHKGVTPNIGRKYIATGWCSYY